MAKKQEKPTLNENIKKDGNVEKEKGITLVVINGFTDRYDDKVKYVVGDEITITDKARVNDLLARNLCIKKDR